jgi:hypothetical protein
MKSLEIQLTDRFSSAHEMAQQLEIWLGPSAGSSTIFVPAPRTATHHWKWVSAGLALLLAGGGVAFWLKNPATPKAPHAPVSVLVADFTNHTGDPIFDDTLELMFNVALEGASFVRAFNRGDAKKLAQQLSRPSDKLDEQPHAWLRSIRVSALSSPAKLVGEETNIVSRQQHSTQSAETLSRNPRLPPPTKTRFFLQSLGWPPRSAKLSATAHRSQYSSNPWWERLPRLPWRQCMNTASARNCNSKARCSRRDCAQFCALSRSRTVAMGGSRTKERTARTGAEIQHDSESSLSVTVDLLRTVRSSQPLTFQV